MGHYICKGECHGVSDKPGVCQAKDCSLYKKKLIECDCNNPESHQKE